LNREGKPIGRIEQPRIMEPIPALSPDGTRAAVAIRTDDKWDIWIVNLTTGAATQVTSDGMARRPNWSPDGKSIVYDSGLSPTTSGTAPTAIVKRASADGSGQLDEFGPGRDAVMSHDGQHVLYMREFKILSRPVGGGSETSVLTGPHSSNGVPRPSPDGRFLAFMTMTPVSVRISVTTNPPGPTRLEIAARESWWPRWSGGGRQLLYATAKDVQAVDVNTEPTLRLGIPRRLFERSSILSGNAPTPFDVSADGGRFLVVEQDKSLSPPRSMVVVTNFTPDRGSEKR
jgi:Tol biopolymer transport system component